MASANHQPRIERMTGLAADQVNDLVTRVAAHGLWPLRRRRALDPHQSVTAVLLYLRHNLSQPLLAEMFRCSQPTISRLITLLIPILTEVLTPNTQATAERELRSTVRIDGFLVAIGDRRKNTYTSGMYSGKRHRCGFNVQVVASWHGRLVMTGRPQPGAMHDARAWKESGLADVFAGRLHADGGPGGFADTAYTGTGLTVPPNDEPAQKPLARTPASSTRRSLREEPALNASSPTCATGRSSPPATADYSPTSPPHSPQSRHSKSTEHRQPPHE
jgi:hypothetical protein